MCRVEEKISPNDRQLFRMTIDPTITHGKKLATVIISLQLVNLLVTYWYSYYRSNYYTHRFLLPQKRFSFFFQWIWFLRSGYVFFLYFNSSIGSKKIEYYTYIEKRRDTRSWTYRPSIFTVYHSRCHRDRFAPRAWFYSLSLSGGTDLLVINEIRSDYPSLNLLFTFTSWQFVRSIKMSTRSIQQRIFAKLLFPPARNT